LNFRRNKNVTFNLASLEFIRTFGNNTAKPRCRAAEATITVSADGYLMLPCFKNKKGKIKIEGTIKETLKKSKELAASQGALPICSGCMMWPYMIPSFFHRIDRYFFLNLRSLFDLYWKEYKLGKGVKS